MNWWKCEYCQNIMKSSFKFKIQRNGQSDLEGQYWAEEKLQGQKGQLTYTRKPTSVSLTSSF